MDDQRLFELLKELTQFEKEGRKFFEPMMMNIGGEIYITGIKANLPVKILLPEDAQEEE